MKKSLSFADEPVLDRDECIQIKPFAIIPQPLPSISSHEDAAECQILQSFSDDETRAKLSSQAAAMRQALLQRKIALQRAKRPPQKHRLMIEKGSWKSNCHGLSAGCSLTVAIALLLLLISEGTWQVYLIIGICAADCLWALIVLFLPKNLSRAGATVVTIIYMLMLGIITVNPVAAFTLASTDSSGLSYLALGVVLIVIVIFFYVGAIWAILHLKSAVFGRTAMVYSPRYRRNT